MLKITLHRHIKSQLSFIRTFSRIVFNQLTQECTLPHDEVSIGNFLYYVYQRATYAIPDMWRLISKVADCHFNLWSFIVFWLTSFGEFVVLIFN